MTRGRRETRSPGDGGRVQEAWLAGGVDQSPKIVTWSCWERGDPADEVWWAGLSRLGRRRPDGRASRDSGDHWRLEMSWSGGPPRIQTRLCSCPDHRSCSNLHLSGLMDFQVPRYQVLSQNHYHEGLMIFGLLLFLICHLQIHILVLCKYIWIRYHNNQCWYVENRRLSSWNKWIWDNFEQIFAIMICYCHREMRTVVMF